MSTAIWVVVALVVVAVLAAAGYFVMTRSRTARLRRRFGPEYDRAVERQGGRAAAERELRSREQRHEELELRDLDPRRREEYREQWVRVQERFVDAPEAAVEQADQLVTVVMGERGYPTHGFEEKVAHLSVEHGRTLDHYRRAHTISGRAATKEASTEDLRQAMVHYRALFEELLAPHGEAHHGKGEEHAARNSARHAAPHTERRAAERTDDHAGRNPAAPTAPAAGDRGDDRTMRS
ncbi:hypothetical protein [Actinomadura mexicana]|uniref:Secreted protein n=1 Tax=Actinomadura mexicana TaxID=134959 RepID=A0A239FD08_9ACTN|nr:hypothetical protein [Actinomadura mexicana]SNS53964.1 hypothetical protein SAMN06265355_12024 [Actinomadura mexicana]